MLGHLVNPSLCMSTNVNGVIDLLVKDYYQSSVRASSEEDAL